MTNKKYQVFISSTYSDLIEERKKVLDILLMADCIPAGMEAFVATDIEQFEVIKKVIDLCDYYVLIIGKRYGSIHPSTGVSYTEMEYDYAREKGIPVLVFALDESVNLDDSKVDLDEERKQKLSAFRAKALKNRLASIWHTVDELAGQIAISIMKAKAEIERPGWQRGQNYDEASLRREIMEAQDKIRKLNTELRTARNTIKSLTEPVDVAFDDCIIDIDYTYTVPHGRTSSRERAQAHIPLPRIFKIIATEMMEVAISESKIENILESQLRLSTHSYHFSDRQLIKRILIQLKSAKLINNQWSEQRNLTYWGLTQKGEKLRNDMLIIRNSNC